MGPGLNPQYTGAPKAGGGCGLLAKSTTTSPMAQPQCGNVNIFSFFSFYFFSSSQGKQNWIGKRGWVGFEQFVGEINSST